MNKDACMETYQRKIDYALNFGNVLNMELI